MEELYVPNWNITPFRGKIQKLPFPIWSDYVNGKVILHSTLFLGTLYLHRAFCSISIISVSQAISPITNKKISYVGQHEFLLSVSEILQSRESMLLIVWCIHVTIPVTEICTPNLSTCVFQIQRNFDFILPDFVFFTNLCTLLIVLDKWP
jgi:hypothetical protein